MIYLGETEQHGEWGWPWGGGARGKRPADRRVSTPVPRFYSPPRLLTAVLRACAPWAKTADQVVGHLELPPVVEAH